MKKFDKKEEMMSELLYLVADYGKMFDIPSFSSEEDELLEDELELISAAKNEFYKSDNDE